MVAVSMHEARTELKLVEGQLEECIQKAWVEFRSVMASTHPGMRVRCRRTLHQDLVVKHVEAAFGEIPGFKVLEDGNGRVLLIVADRLVLQFKHIKRDFRTANFPTKLARDFDAQRHIDGLPPLPRLTVGYRLDQLETKVEGIYVIFAVAKQRVWHYRLDDDAFGTEVLELLPVDPTPDAGTGTRRRVGPKRPADDGKVVPLHTQTQ